MKDNILITGSKGFIGQKLEGGKAFQGDVSDIDTLHQEAKGTRGIVHLAAKSNRQGCESDVIRTIESNLLGVYTVLEVALKLDIWVLFVSTFQVKDRNFYGLSKLMGEEMCRIYKDKGVKVHILRLPIVYGKGEKPTKIVSKFINLIQKGIEPKIDTREKFYFAYVDDVIRIIEHDVAVLEWESGKKHTLTELSEGIKKCLNIGK